MALTDHFTIWFSGSLVVVAIFCFFLLKRYAFAPQSMNTTSASKTTASTTIKVFTFIGWFLGFATIALLPLDIALADSKATTNESHLYSLRVFWKAFYWATFTFAYLVVPIMSYYEDSGELEPKKRLIEALKMVGATYAVYVIIGAIFLTVLWFRGTFSSGDFSLTGFLMALGCVYGLLQIIIFLGYGLVSVPKSIYCQTSLDQRLELAFCRIDQCEDTVQQARLQDEDLLTICISLKHHKVVTNPEDLQFLEQLLEKFPTGVRDAATPYTVKEQIAKKFLAGTHKELVLLSKEISLAHLELSQSEEALKRTYRKAFKLEKLKHEVDKGGNPLSNKDWNVKNMEQVKAKLQPLIYKTATIVCALLSAYIVICEILIMFQLQSQLLPSHNIFLVSFLLLYFSLTTYYGLFNIKISSIYKLDSTGHTNSFSLLYSARYLTGLAPPLCFNFLKLTNVTNTQFHKVLNPMDAIPIIGTQFQTFFPAILAILCLINYFDVWTKIVSSVGLEELAFSEVFDPSRVENGRKLLQFERNRQVREGISNAGIEASNFELKSKNNPIDYSDGEDDEDSPLTPLAKH